jgi:hypothetical protein
LAAQNPDATPDVNLMQAFLQGVTPNRGIVR